MKYLRLFPKLFLYTLGILLFIVLISHGLLYLFAPRMQFQVNPAAPASDTIEVSINQEKLVTESVKRALPVSLVCSFLLSALCSFLFSKAITRPIEKISAATGRMLALDRTANCPVRTQDEIGMLAQNVNSLYAGLLSTIEHLEQEKNMVRDMERAKADFLRAASHELKTPVTALNATLENMILGVGKYQDYAAHLPACKEMTEQLSRMIHDILEAAKPGSAMEPSVPADVSALLQKLCKPWQMIASAHAISFSLDLPEQFSATLPVGPFCKAVSNVLANAVAYTDAGKRVAVYMDGRSLIIENECVPIPADEIHRLFEPFYRPGFSRSRKGGGNGLGLYLVDTLLTSMRLPYSFSPMSAPAGMRFTIRL